MKKGRRLTVCKNYKPTWKCSGCVYHPEIRERKTCYSNPKESEVLK